MPRRCGWLNDIGQCRSRTGHKAADQKSLQQRKMSDCWMVCRNQATDCGSCQKVLFEVRHRSARRWIWIATVAITARDAPILVVNHQLGMLVLGNPSSTIDGFGLGFGMK